MEILNGLQKWANGLPQSSGRMPWVQLLICFATVFVGLVCIVIICKIVGLFCKGAAKKEAAESAAASDEMPAPAPAENRAEIIAAVTAVCAEEMGKDVKALRVVSFKKL